MSLENDITQWIGKLKTGEDEAAKSIWDAYFPRVCGLARKKLGEIKKRSFDEEDLALSAMNALCVGAQQGKFAQLDSREDLWQILAMITARKAANSWRKESRRAEMGESIFARNSSGELGAGIDHLRSRDSNDQIIDSLSDTCGELLSLLDEKLRVVALLRLQGYSNAEIAKRQNRSIKSIERYLKLIREKWDPQLHGEDRA